MLEFLHVFITTVAIILEVIGAFIIVIAVIQELIDIVKSKFNFDICSNTLSLYKGIALALEIILAAEILKTLLIQTTHELLILAGIVVLRTIIGFVIHWELKEKEKSKLCN